MQQINLVFSQFIKRGVHPRFHSPNAGITKISTRRLYSSQSFKNKSNKRFGDWSADEIIQTINIWDQPSRAMGIAGFVGSMTVLIGVVLLGEIESDPDYFSAVNEKIEIERSIELEKDPKIQNDLHKLKIEAQETLAELDRNKWKRLFCAYKAKKLMVPALILKELKGNTTTGKLATYYAWRITSTATAQLSLLTAFGVFVAPFIFHQFYIQKNKLMQLEKQSELQEHINSKWTVVQLLALAGFGIMGVGTTLMIGFLTIPVTLPILRLFTKKIISNVVKKDLRQNKPPKQQSIY